MRISVLRFTTDHQMVAEAFKELLKNHTVTEHTEDGKAVIEIEGDYSQFVLEDMEVWENHIKIEIKDNRIECDTDKTARSIIAEGEPGLAEILFSPTIAFVYKRIETKTRTTTITETLEDGVEMSRYKETKESDPVYTWKDITRDFGRITTRTNRLHGVEM